MDEDLELVLIGRYPGDPVKGYVPAYRFKLARHREMAPHQREAALGQDPGMGYIELRVGNTHHITMYGGHIGYRVDPEHRGHHYAARAVKLLLPLARHHGLNPLWITCNPDNIASRRTCELAGAQLVEIVDLPADTDMYQRGERQKCRYRLDL